MAAHPGQHAPRLKALVQPCAKRLGHGGAGLGALPGADLAKAQRQRYAQGRRRIAQRRQRLGQGGDGQRGQPFGPAQVDIQRGVPRHLHRQAKAVDHPRMFRDGRDAAAHGGGAGRAVEPQRRPGADADDDGRGAGHCSQTPVARTESGVPVRRRSLTVVPISFSSRPGGTSSADSSTTSKRR